MKKLFKIFALLVLLLILIGNRNQIKGYFNAEEVEEVLDVVVIEEPDITLSTEEPKKDYFVNDSLYRWDEALLDWRVVNVSGKMSKEETGPNFTSFVSINNTAKATEIDWKLLEDIEYQLKYFQKIKMEMYAPVFSEALKKLDGKKVIIKGYVIPVDTEGELFALSANPYSACFFCGKAGPASVMSMYMKKKKSFKADAFKKIKGILSLNYDDPEEFYYILKEAIPVR